MLIATGLLMGAGCAVIDSSNLETANNLRKGQFKAIAYVSEQATVHRMIYANQLAPNNDEESDKTSTTIGIKLGMGLSNKTEVDLSVAGPFTFNAKAAVKNRLSPDDAWIQIAVMPGIQYGKGIDDVSFWTDEYYADYTSMGLDLPLLLSHKFSKCFSTTACLKTSVYHIKFKKIDNCSDAVMEQGTFDTLISGVSFTPRLKVWKFVLLPEAGIYYYKTRYDKDVFQPAYHLGIGFDTGM